MNVLRIEIVSVLLGMAVMAPCQALPELQWQDSASGLHEGYVQELGLADTLWISTFEGIETPAKISVPSFAIGQEISEGSGDDRQKCLLGIWQGMPAELKDRLRRIGAVEERGGTLKFRMPLRIVYAFHSVPSLPKQLALASVDAKLTKPYLLALQPLENIAHAQWIGFFDEGDAIHCRRFPGGYLLRKQTGALGHDPLYTLEVTPRAGAMSMSLCLLSLATDPRSKTLAISLSFHVFVDTTVTRLDIPAINNLWQRMELPRASLYRTAGISDAVAFHRSTLSDLFPLLDDNPDLRDILNENCFGSLIDLELLLPVLRNLPVSLLFITDKNTRARCKSSLRVSLTEEGVVPVINVDKLRSENSRLDQRILDIIVRDAEHYNEFARALWQHVRSAIVSDREASPEVYSINDARDTLCVLDEDVPAAKRLLDAVALLDESEFKCTEWKILSASAHAGTSGYLGLQLFILPETDRSVAPEHRAHEDRLITHLYQYAYDRIAIALDKGFTQNFLRDVKQRSEVAYLPVVDMQHLDRYQIAEDTNDGKFSCEAVIPEFFKGNFDERKFKNYCINALISCLEVFLSPVQGGELQPIEPLSLQEGQDMYNPHKKLSTVDHVDIYGLAISEVVRGYINNIFNKNLADHKKHPEQRPYLDIFSRLAGISRDATNQVCHWLMMIAGDDLAKDDAKQKMGLFFIKPIAFYVFYRLQQLADECLSKKTLKQIQDTIDDLLASFGIINDILNVCNVGRFEGTLFLFTRLGATDSSIHGLSLKDRVHIMMKMVIECRFSDVFRNVDPHGKLAFRQALEEKYGMKRGVTHKELGHFSEVAEAIKKAGIDSHKLQSLIDPHINKAKIELRGRGFLDSDWRFRNPIDHLTDNKTLYSGLMRLIMTPMAIINTIAENPSSYSVIKRFLQEKHHLSDDQITTLLRSADTKRQIIADMLLSHGYLLPIKKTQ